MKRTTITITTLDHRKLNALLTSAFARLIVPSTAIDELKTLLESAVIVPLAPDGVVTMNSIIVLRDLDTGEAESYALVYPSEADIANRRLSVLAPTGIAVLGRQLGDELHWHIWEGCRRKRIERIFRRLPCDCAVCFEEAPLDSNSTQ